MKPKRKKCKRDWCTAAPDWLPSTGDIGETCCRAHDKAYEIGGTEIDRLRADRALRDCIYAQAKARRNRLRGWVVSRLYYLGVRHPKRAKQAFRYKNAQG